MKFNEVKALVTGGASGLGLAVARHIVEQGGKVVLLDVNDKAGLDAAHELGCDTCYIHTDVSSEAAVELAVAEVVEANGGLNLAVNCAGVLGAGRVLGREAPMELSMFTHTIMINLVGSFNIAKTAANHMQNNEPNEQGERGVIINTASVAAFEGQIGQAAYSASKGGIVSMTLPMARELARFGIRVMTIAPGIFWTPMVDGMPVQVQEALNASIPFPSRLGKPEEFAAMVQHITENSYLNGSTIRLDGAVRLAPK
ncbi:MAG: SDR family NAD(P)-dependent oxidoreductase [Xanthomonadales bacterium]|nr:SDR family NAD(P)-dependent oxidoreductase [Xanthomonadales bacterium]